MAEVQIKATAKEQHRQSIKARAHTFAADAPQQFGGQDSAPDPHELLLGSLGACTSITMQMYAKRKGWDLQELTIDLKEEETEDKDQPGKKTTTITRSIAVSGDLTEEQIDGLRAIADKCPIHKIISGKTHIQTEIKRLTNV